MPKAVLTNKPLVEAIFELRWELPERSAGLVADPHYSLLIGRMYERLSKGYPAHQKLPTASIPEEVAAYVVQHRFRKSEEGWPLVQIGPGIVTLNDTERYDWDDFCPRVSELVHAIFEAYPEPENLKLSALQLRYIDAIEFDFDADNIFEFLRAQMKIDVSLRPELFASSGVTRLPLAFDWRFSFPAKEPRGAMHLRYVRGEKKGAAALIWETTVSSEGKDALPSRDAIQEWVTKAHNLTHTWFFETIRGEELERRFGLCMQ